MHFEPGGKKGCRNLKVCEVEIAKPANDKEVLVKVLASSVNRLDVL